MLLLALREVLNPLFPVIPPVIRLVRIIFTEFPVAIKMDLQPSPFSFSLLVSVARGKRDNSLFFTILIGVLFIDNSGETRYIFLTRIYIYIYVADGNGIDRFLENKLNILIR